MSFYKFLLLLVLAIASKPAASDDCHTKEIELCIGIGLLHYKTNGIPEIEEDVDAWCDAIDEVGSCLKSYTASCFTPMQNEMLGLVVQGTKETSTKFCTANSDIHTQYLRYSPCLVKYSKSVSFRSNVKDLQVALESVFSEKHFSNRVPMMCCAYKRFVKSMERDVANSCGQGTVNMGKVLRRMITSNLPDDICQAFDPESLSCSRMIPAPGTPLKVLHRSHTGQFLASIFGN